MKKKIIAFLFVFMMTASWSDAGLLDNILKGAGSLPSSSGPDESTTASGLKEALAIGTENAVANVSQLDGYFGNQLIRILMPKQIQKVADVMSRFGYQKEVDEFILSMNRAAEKAAPKAISFFGDAIREMTFEDARKILNGGDTAATEFFRDKTHEKIYDAFKPVISSSLDDVGATQAYKQMMGRYDSIPFVDKQSLDLDHYVTNKSLDGLFFMVGEEEKKIRTNPAARVTDLLKTVFGK